MSGQAREQTAEKVGVVVIHGVGETYEGWINGYLVPELEKWAAFNAVDALGRKDRSNDLMLVLPAEDRHILIALDHDQDFVTFCNTLGLQPLIDAPEFKTRARRVKNRTDLSYQLGMVLSLQRAETWLHELRAAGVPCAIAFEPESSVNAVRDPGSSDPTRTWNSFSRRLVQPHLETTVTELYWADMSKVGDTSLSRLSAMLQLTLESPFVLGKAFLKGSKGGIHGLISWLIMVANWIMHWPVAGLNVAIFLAAFTAMAAQKAGAGTFLLETVAGSLAVTIAGGVYLFRKWVHRKVGLAYLSLSGAIYAALLLGVLGVAAYSASAATLARPHEYLIVSITFVLIAWIVWTITTVIAALLLSGVALKRLLTFGKGVGLIPLSRPAAALSLSLILGMIWKAALALLGIMIINDLAPTATTVQQACPEGMTLKIFALTAKGSPACILAMLKALLIDVNVINVASIVAVLLTVLAVVGLRRSMTKVRAKKALAAALSLPRLIASPAIVAVLFMTAITNAILLYVVYFDNFQVAKFLQSWAPSKGAESFSAGLIGIIIFFFLLRRIAEKSDAIVHIGRDLVDHQYDPSPSSFTTLLQKQQGGAAGPRDPASNRFRRRQRIQKRLEALIDDVIVSEQMDRLVLVSHSQGTVIMHDYLLNHDDLVDPSHRGKNTLTSVKRIDVITLGSPLGHIYRYYFQDYDVPEGVAPEKQPLISKVFSWTNMWRIDDPIGRDVTLSQSIKNVPLPPGGHTDYWREDAVCEKIWALIHGLHDSPTHAAAPIAAEELRPVAPIAPALDI